MQGYKALTLFYSKEIDQVTCDTSGPWNFSVEATAVVTHPAGILDGCTAPWVSAYLFPVISNCDTDGVFLPKLLCPCPVRHGASCSLNHSAACDTWKSLSLLVLKTTSRSLCGFCLITLHRVLHREKPGLFSWKVFPT